MGQEGTSRALVVMWGCTCLAIVEALALQVGLDGVVLGSVVAGIVGLVSAFLGLRVFAPRQGGGDGQP